MQQNEIQWKQLGFDKDPQPTGVPWGLLFQIVQTILAILSYMATRETDWRGRAELTHLTRNLRSAAESASPKQGEPK